MVRMWMPGRVSKRSQTERYLPASTPRRRRELMRNPFHAQANASAPTGMGPHLKASMGEQPQDQYGTFGIPMGYGTGIDRNDYHTRAEWPSNDQTSGHTL